MPVSRTLLCFSLLLLPKFAIAAPVPIREDVIATAMRCSVIADSHQWLDCFYGSAQQMRLSLKLAPVPNNQLRLTQNPPSGGPVYDANIRVSVLSAAVNCENLDDDRNWLNCYYGSTDPMRVKLGLKPLSPNGAYPASPVQPRAPTGLTVSNDTAALAGRTSIPANNPIHFPLVSQVKSYSFNQLGMFTVALTNGQVWRQLSGDTNYARSLIANDVITISRGAFGSYNLRFGKHPEYFKVSRTQ
jgi:hypothetical protein